MLVVNGSDGEPSEDGRRTLAQRLVDPGLRRTVGWSMLVVAALGLLAAILGVVVAWRLLSNLTSTTADTLAVTVEALDSIADTIEVADGTISATSDALAELESTLATLAESLDTGGDVVADTAQLTGTAAPALADATVTLRQMESIGEGIDGFLAAVASIPFTPDFNAERGLGPTFGRLADDIDPLDEELTATARSLETFEGSLADLRTDVDDLVITIGRVNRELADGEELLVDYRENVNRARELARASGSDVQRDQTALRWLVVAAGLAFAVGQMVPLWIGLSLLATPQPAPASGPDPGQGMSDPGVGGSDPGVGTSDPER